MLQYSGFDLRGDFGSIGKLSVIPPLASATPDLPSLTVSVLAFYPRAGVFSAEEPQPKVQTWGPGPKKTLRGGKVRFSNQ